MKDIIQKCINLYFLHASFGARNKIDQRTRKLHFRFKSSLSKMVEEMTMHISIL